MSTQSQRRVAVVTGASAGIGKATAARFLSLGWHVIGTGRDPQRSAAALADLKVAAKAGGGKLNFVRGDFCEMKDVLRVAGEIGALTDRIDVLVNNAGGVRDARYTSSEGIEATMAANHFGPFLLTRQLLPLLRKAAAESAPGEVRVLVVSSSGHEFCPEMRWDDLMWDKDYAAGGIYCQAKLANMLFTRELNRRLAGDGIVAQAMHPGVVDSNFASHADAGMQGYLSTLEAHTPEHSAETLVWMATAPENGIGGGRYFHDGKEAEAAPQAKDDAAAARLWAETEKVLSDLGY